MKISHINSDVCARASFV